MNRNQAFCVVVLIYVGIVDVLFYFFNIILLSCSLPYFYHQHSETKMY